jgi:pimeloyl-ACP methyl ester carboxylesterase
MIAVAARTAASTDGTRIGYRTVGAGEALIVVGGALRTAEDYMPLADALSREFEVHVMDRRGRPASGPHGSDYSIEKECEDLDAVIAQTGATRVFGHSYGGLVALETGKRNTAIDQIVAYEPGVSVRGSIPSGWIPEYRRRLDKADRRGAFAAFVRGSGHAPAIVSRLPLRYLDLVLRIAIKQEQWRRMDALLEANLAENEEVRRLDSTVATYAQVSARVLLLGGSKSPAASRVPLDALHHVIPDAHLELIDGVAHNAPDEGAPERVAERVARFLAEEDPPGTR